MTSLLALLLDVMATVRLTRLVTADTIANPPREAVIRWAYGRDPADWRRAREMLATEHLPDRWREVALADTHPPRLAELVTCPWCASMWLAGGVVAARQLAPRAWPLVARALTMSAAAGAATGRL